MSYNPTVAIRVTDAYLAWVNGLTDIVVRARIQVRVDRLAHGNAGDHRLLRGGVAELRIDLGPGYRVYFTRRGGRIVLLAGGDKATQRRDIRRAVELARNL